MNPEGAPSSSAALERARSSLTRTSAVHTGRSRCPCACQMESGAEQEAHCNSEMKGKKHFSIEDTSSECFGISAVKVLCKSCRTLTEIVGGEDAGAVKTIGTFEGTPLKCSSKKDRKQSNKWIHVLPDRNAMNSKGKRHRSGHRSQFRARPFRSYERGITVDETDREHVDQQRG